MKPNENSMKIMLAILNELEKTFIEVADCESKAETFKLADNVSERIKAAATEAIKQLDVEYVQKQYAIQCCNTIREKMVPKLVIITMTSNDPTSAIKEFFVKSREILEKQMTQSDTSFPC